jgi:hypothetical protein
MEKMQSREESPSRKYAKIATHVIGLPVNVVGIMQSMCIVRYQLVIGGGLLTRGGAN